MFGFFGIGVMELAVLAVFVSGAVALVVVAFVIFGRKNKDEPGND
jgi:hypothetical protein